MKKYDYEVLCTYAQSDEKMGKEVGNVVSMGVQQDYNYADVKWTITGEVKTGRIVCSFSRGLEYDLEKDTILEQRRYEDGEKINETIKIGNSGLQENIIWVQTERESDFNITMKLERRSRGYQILIDKLGLNILSRF